VSALNDYRELVLPSPIGQTADSAWTKLLQWRSCADAAITELVNECGVRANKASELRATIRRLEGTSQAQEGFFHAAMDRANRAEAELADETRLQKDVDEAVRKYTEQMKRAEQAESELAALKGQRCETCAWLFDTTSAQTVPRCLKGVLTGARVDFACNRWAARAEEGREDE
jgi:Arc/MetJ-type ribon-helix-helix transcriptional regulator